MRLYRVILPVRDIEAAAKFYGNLIGEQGQRVSDGRHYFGSAATGAILACYSPREDGDAAEHGEDWRPHRLQYVYFSVDDIESARERCIRAGATSVTFIEHMPWGETLFYAQDPFGNPISIVKSGTEFTGSSGTD